MSICRLWSRRKSQEARKQHDDRHFSLYSIIKTHNGTFSVCALAVMVFIVIPLHHWRGRNRVWIGIHG